GLHPRCPRDPLRLRRLVHSLDESDRIAHCDVLLARRVERWSSRALAAPAPPIFFLRGHRFLFRSISAPSNTAISASNLSSPAFGYPRMNSTNALSAGVRRQITPS